jgi:iron complex transport system ATP-binding protein
MKMELNNVACGYRGNRVVNGFFALVSSGDILCLLGPNGVGKTTLFKCILGLLPVLDGSISVDGRNISEFSVTDYAKIVGYVPQAHIPPFSFTVLDVVAMGRTVHTGLLGRLGERDLRIAADCLERLEIGRLADRVYTELSGGERQMVLIARALAQQPAFLLMDEPTSNLDFGNQARVLKIIRMLVDEGLGVVMTTHHPDHVFGMNAGVSLLVSGDEAIPGNAEQVLTEENLRKAYGIKVAVISASYCGQELRLCRPAIDRADHNNRDMSGESPESYTQKTFL